MKFYLLTIVLLNVTLSDALGDGPDAQLTEQVINMQNQEDLLERGVDAQGFVNEGNGEFQVQEGSMAMGVAVQGNMQANFVAPAAVTTQRVNIAPRYITEKVTAKPKVIVENVVQPVYQKIINRPSILRERIVPVPQYNRAPTQVVNNEPVVQPVQQRTSTVTKNVVVPGNQIHIQPVIQPRVLIREDNVRVQQSEPQVIRHPAEVRPVQTRYTNTEKVVNVPGRQIVTQKFVQPIIQRENVNVQVQKGPTRRINHQPIVQPAVVQNRVRNQRVVVPGNVVYNQPIIQPIIRNQTTEVQFVQGAPQNRVNEPIVRPTSVSNSSNTVYRNVPYNVPVERVIPVRTPYVQKVTHVREVFVPVDENGNEIGPDYQLNAGGSANIVNNTHVHVSSGDDKDCGRPCCGNNCNRITQPRDKQRLLAELYL